MNVRSRRGRSTCKRRWAAGPVSLVAPDEQTSDQGRQQNRNKRHDRQGEGTHKSPVGSDDLRNGAGCGGTG